MSAHHASLNIIDLYERHALEYAADRGRELWIERAWLDRFTALLPRGGSILDLGCGSGEPIARHLIEQGFALEGVDTSPTLIARCRARFPERTWHLGDMRTLGRGARFDGLLAWDSFFHLTADDQRAMFQVFAQHVARGGVLMFTSGSAHGEAIGSYRGEPLYHASLDPAEYEALLAAHGFQVVAYAADDAECGGHTIWLARRAISETEGPSVAPPNS